MSISSNFLLQSMRGLMKFNTEVERGKWLIQFSDSVWFLDANGPNLDL